MATCGALERRFELPDKEINNLAIIETKVPLPSFRSFLAITKMVKTELRYNHLNESKIQC
jgi:hypothetical protein